MRKRISAALACLAVGVIGLTGSASAAPVTWNIVSSASTISLAIPNQTLTITSSSSIVSGVVGTSLTISLRALNPGTASGSTPTGWTIGNKQNVQGTIETDTDFTSSIEFLTGSNIEGIDSGSYAPLANGDAGTSSADFGVRIYAGAGIILGGLNLDMAIRDVLYEVLSGPIGIGGGGSFAASGTDFGLDNASLAYKGRNGFGLGGSAFVGLIGSGAASIGGLSTDNSAGSGSVVVVGPNATLTLPISQTLAVPLDDAGLLVFKLNVAGNLVATAVVPEPATMGMMALGLAMLAPAAVRRWKKRS